ncbi:hypothetical protein ACLKA6_016051 [Drosophila palustris]
MFIVNRQRWLPQVLVEWVMELRGTNHFKIRHPTTSSPGGAAMDGWAWHFIHSYEPRVLTRSFWAGQTEQDKTGVVVRLFILYTCLDI